MANNVDFEVAIIGAGFAGIGAGIQLKMHENDSFIIFERSNDIGGTWRDNTYPGCGCDIPSFLYSYSFEPNPDWSRSFSPQVEILNYLKNCVRKYKLENHLKMNSEIVSAKFDQNKGYWEIKDQGGRITKARVIISAAGPFNSAFIPEIKGQNNFTGESFHSLYWNHDYDFKEKKVAVIGTGASAIQFVPEIADQVKDMHIFQRTAPWIQEKPDEEITEKSKKRFRRFPWYQRFWREIIYWILEYRGKALYAPNSMRRKRTKECLDHLHASIPPGELRDKLTPDYELGCKRVLISNNYYPTLLKKNVHLNTEGIEEILSNGIRTKVGKVYEFDCIIYSTGFNATKFDALYEVIGLDGQNLFEAWNEKGAEAYYGMTMNNFPNLMISVGPNTGLGHNSIIHMMESQFTYILDYLKHLNRTKKKSDYFNLKASVQKSFNEKIQKELKHMVWSEGGCNSYYLKNYDGKNTSIWPGSTVSYRKQTKKVNIGDYTLISPKQTSHKPTEIPVEAS